MLHRKNSLLSFFWWLFVSAKILYAKPTMKEQTQPKVPPPSMEELDFQNGIYRGRHRQIQQRKNTIYVSLSIWAAQLTTQQDFLDLLENEDVKKGVLDTVLQVLCTISDLRLVDRAATFFDPDILDMFDTCRTFSEQRSRRRIQGSTPAVLSALPEVATMLRGSEDLLWVQFSMAFPLLRIGDLYIEEALMNNEGISLLEIGNAATEALQQVVQLAMDVTMMEGELDDMLHNTVEGHILYAAPILQEREIFTLAALDYQERYQFTARSIYPMRVCGVLMLLSSVVIYLLLIIASRIRRLRISLAEEAFHRDTPSIVHFRDSKGVERLLEQSSPEGLADSDTEDEFGIPTDLGRHAHPNHRYRYSNQRDEASIYTL